MDLPRLEGWYLDRVRERARELESDVCTFVPDFYADACLEHDVHWRQGKTIFGAPISLWEANTWFRKRIQERSLFGVLSPMSWWRWAGVTVVACFRRGGESA